MGFSLVNQLLGYPYDELEPPIIPYYHPILFHLILRYEPLLAIINHS